MRKLLMGMGVDQVASRDATGNPGGRDWFAAFAARRQARVATPPLPPHFLFTNIPGRVREGGQPSRPCRLTTRWRPETPRRPAPLSP